MDRKDLFRQKNEKKIEEIKKKIQKYIYNQNQLHELLIHNFKN